MFSGFDQGLASLLHVVRKHAADVVVFVEAVEKIEILGGRRLGDGGCDGKEKGERPAQVPA
jgi:hypothetical protein